MNTGTAAASVRTPVEEQPTERRVAPRHRCLSECLVRVEGAGEPLDWPGMVYNISASGIGLALPFPGLLGTVLVIQPRRARTPRTFLRARVARCALQEYVWFHGCEFLTPLSQKELERWLDEFRAERLPQEPDES
jgi:hypothetical protein